jgi:hypothetical protein
MKSTSLAFSKKYVKISPEEQARIAARDEAIMLANMITIPVSIRTFMRESEGKVFKEKGGKKVSSILFIATA